MSNSLKRFMKVYDVNHNFIGFYVGKWSDSFIRVLLVPKGKESANLEDIINMEELEKKVMDHALFTFKSTREKLENKLHKEYGDFPDEKYFSYIIRYALDHHIRISESYRINNYYTLFHQNSISIEESYISLIRPEDNYSEINIVKTLENTKVFGNRISGFIGQISGPVDVAYKSISVSVALKLGYENILLPELLAPFTTGDATLTLFIPYYVDFQYGDHLVVRGTRDYKDASLLNVSSIYSLTRGVLWRVK